MMDFSLPKENPSQKKPTPKLKSSEEVFEDLREELRESNISYTAVSLIIGIIDGWENHLKEEKKVGEKTKE